MHICATIPYKDNAVGKRGPSSFKKLDVERAIRSAREAGFAPGIVEIETKDGATIRIYAHKAASQVTPDTTGAKVRTDKTKA
jgi:hypothetical protein